MSSLTVRGCFYLDSCIVLADILGQYINRINKFKKDVHDYNIECYVSRSVESECKGRLDKTIDFLGNIFQNLAGMWIEETRKLKHKKISDPLTYEDIHIFENLFIELNKQRADRFLDVLQSPLQIVEQWIVSFLEDELTKATGVDIQSFMTKLIARLLSLNSVIETMYEQLITLQQKYIRISNEVPEASIIDSLIRLDIHQPDATHIATAAKHQMVSGETTVFVTFDFNSILIKQKEIFDTVRIFCCDPLYSIHHLERLH